MICLATPADAALVSSLLAPFSPIALSLWADWQLWLQNPQQAQKFYLINSTAVLQYGGLIPALFGSCPNRAELLQFLNLLQITKLESNVALLPGWQSAKYQCLCYTPRKQCNSSPILPPGYTLLASPAPSKIMQALQAAEQLPKNGRDCFYTMLCCRYNHGIAQVVAVTTPDGVAVATAGLYAIKGSQAYFSAVEVAPAYRHKGLGTCMVQHLLQAHPNTQIILACDTQAQAFYKQLGFQITQTPYYLHQKIL